MTIKRHRLMMIGLSLLVMVLWFTSRPTPAHAGCGGELQIDKPVSARVSSGECYFYFDGKAGAEITIQMTKVTSSLDPYLILIDPNGYIIAEDDDSGGSYNAKIDGARLAESGQYEIVATTYNGQGVGTFTLSATEGSDFIERKITTDGTIVRDTISASNQKSIFTFDGEQGERVTISMESLSGDLDPYLELYDENGKLVTSDDDSGLGYDAMISRFRLARTGRYEIVATAYGSTTGSFGVSVTTNR